MRRPCVFVPLGVLATVTFASVAASGQEKTPPPASPLGFLPASRSGELQSEAYALGIPTPNDARAWLNRLTEEPHVAGTVADQKTAMFVRDKLREWGWKVELAEYEVLLNYPTNAFLRLNRPTEQILPLMEKPIVLDKDSASPAAFGAFHGYGVSGAATGQVVYANYGRPEDFESLEKQGVDVAGKVVLVRYGELFRGLKVRNAQKRGAKGVLIYSDPGDDGYAKGDVYPAGPFRPESAIQRGSVQFLSIQPGDPSTPGGPSIGGAKRLPIDPARGFPIGEEDWEKTTGLKRADYFATIPSLPISYGSARPILEALGGPNVPTGWQGGLPLAYHVGPGPAEVTLQTEMDYKVRTIWNVIATLPGAVEPDRWVLVGNHRDAWVYGAVDPGSGTAATLEMCHALGAAVKQGWKPRRTLVYASWDGEEYGLVGSTEWAEHHAAEIDKKTVLLLNVDSAVSGHELDLDGVPSLRDWVLDAAAAVTDVRTGKTLRQSWLAAQRQRWASQDPVDLPDVFTQLNGNGNPIANGTSTGQGSGLDPAAIRASSRFVPQMKPLGSGSDYTVFLDHLGIPAVDAGFSGRYGVYHSVYDNFTWMEKVGDPGFITHATAARLYTVLAMRAAAAEVVPLKFVPYAEALRDYTDDLRRRIERKLRATDPAPAGSAYPHESLAAVIKAVRTFHDQAVALDQATDQLTSRDGVSAETLAQVNDALSRIERTLLLPDGLPGRPWFKHAIYAPGLTTGYASWPLPALRQALEDNDASLFQAAATALAARLTAASAALRDASAAAR